MKSPSPDLVAHILALLDRLPRTARALVLGAAVRPWIEPLRLRGFEVETREDLEAVPNADASIDLVLAVGVLEHLEWDRWTLQRAHALLKDGGRLVVAVPNRLALGAPEDLAFLASRALREARRRIRSARGMPPARLRFESRRYGRAALVDLLESLGFRILHQSSLDSGWLAPIGGPASFMRRHLVMCERGPSLFGLDPRRPFPDPAEHRRRFEGAHRSLVDERDRWLERHPGYRRASSRALEPSAYSGADVLVLAPHPDDDVIPCAGTLAQLVAVGARVTIVHATDGSEAASLWHAPDEARRTVRLEEARRVAAVMGFDSLVFWKEDNRAFRPRQDLVARLAEMLAARRPRLIFVPFVTDIHPDHVVLCQILARALALLHDPLNAAEVLGYQTWCLVPIDVHCVVTREMPLVERAISTYVTAMKVEDYVHFAQDHDYYNACTRGLAPGFAEAFFAVPAAEFAQLLATVAQPHG